MKYQNIDTIERRGSYGGMTSTVLGTGKNSINVLKSKISPLPKGARMTVGQRTQQARVATLMAAYDALKPLLAETLMREKPMQTSNGLFLKHNVHNVQVLLTKKQADGGLQVLDNYVVSDSGSRLGSITVDTIGGNHLFGINVGHLTITADTTLYEFSNAIVANNNGIFKYGDGLTIVVCTQALPHGRGYAKIRLATAMVELYGYNNEHGQQPLSSVAPIECFHTTELDYGNGVTTRFLSFPQEDYTLVAPIHSRRLSSGAVVCSDQRLHGNNPYIAKLKHAQPQGDDLLLTYGKLKPHNDFNPTTQPTAQQHNSLTLDQYLAAHRKQDPTAE